MYNKNIHHTFPLYTTCAAATLKFSNGRPDSGISSAGDSIMSPRNSPAMIIPVQSPGQPIIPPPLIMDDEDPLVKSSSSPSSSWWSWTFSLFSWPFIAWGCPFYLIIVDESRRYGVIRTTGSWLRRVFDCSSAPCLTIITVILLAFTLVVDGYFLYLFSMLMKQLFIDGVYASEMLFQVLDFLRDVPVLIPLNYVWLRGYKINNIVCLLNQKYLKFSHLSCARYRVTLIILLLLIVAIHLIRFFSYAKYQIITDASSNMKNITGALASIDYVWNFSVDIFVSLMIPVYCAFCFAIRFELNVIKALIYEMISTRVTPTMVHLNKFKMLYTHAADHIDAVNGIFSSYMSIAIIFMFIGTIADAEHLLMALTGIGGSLIATIFEKIAENGGKVVEGIQEQFTTTLPPPTDPPTTTTQATTTTTTTLPPTTTPSTTLPTTTPSTTSSTTEFIVDSTITALMDLTSSSSTEFPTSMNIESAPANNNTFHLKPSDVRQVNSDILCIILVYGLIFYAVWQAVATNDSARELHVWLNDLVTGGGGTDVDSILIDLGTAKQVLGGNSLILRRKNVAGVIPAESLDTWMDDHLPPIWGSNKYAISGESDQFLDKFKLLKAYIHVRMQLERPALLTIALVGIIVPSLSGRLKRYSVIF